MTAARTTPGFGAKILAAGVAVVVALGLAEIMARVVYPAPPERGREPQLLYQSDPDLGFIHQPGQSGYLEDGLATIGAAGFRGPGDLAFPKPAGTLRIVAIGDSTTFGWGVNDADSYPARLQDRLRGAYPDLQAEVVNAGVVSYDLRQARRLLEKYRDVLAPDVLLIGVFWNDLPYEAVTPEGAPVGGRRTEVRAPARAGAAGDAPHTFRLANQPDRLTRMLRRSRLAFALRHAWLKTIAPTSAATNQVRWEMALLEGRTSPAIDAAWEEVGGTLAALKAIADRDGYPAGVVIIPIRAQVEQAFPSAAYQTRVRAMAQALDLFVVDPLPMFRADPDPSSLFIPYDRMHFSPKGNQVLADAVFAVLRERQDAVAGGRPSPGGTP